MADRYNPFGLDYLRGPADQPSYSVDSRWPDQPDVASAFKMGGLAGTDEYAPATYAPFDAYDRAQQAQHRDEKQAQNVQRSADVAASLSGQQGPVDIRPVLSGMKMGDLAGEMLAPDDVLDATTLFSPKRFGAIGKAIPAVAGAVLGSDPAEAASRKAILSSTDVLNRLRPGDPNYWHRIAPRKLDRPLDAIPYTESGAMPPISRQVNPAELEGKFLMPLPGDPTKRGTTITSIDEVPLRDPFLTHGGRSYIDELGGFANAGPAATAAANRVKELEKKYDTEVLGNFTKMGAQSADFSGHTWALLARMFPEAPMSKSGVEKMDAAIRNEVKAIKPTTAMEKAGEVWHWPSQPPSVKDDVFEQYLAGQPHIYRQAVINAVEKQRGVIPGVPDVVAARYAATDPTQLHARTHTSGLTMTPLTGKTRPSAHPDYPVHLEGGASVGLGQNIPREVMYHDLVRAFDKSQPDPAFWLRKMQMPPSGVPYGQLATPKWVDRTSEYMDDAAKMGEIAALNKYMLKHHKWD
jgi:hypothetical protein